MSSVISVHAPTQKKVFLHQKLIYYKILFVLVVLMAVFYLHFLTAYSQKTKETIKGMFFIILSVTFML